MFQPGELCDRIENRADVRATVLVVHGETSVQIAYIEGGSGWWPPDALAPVSPEE
jgi:hypothetical protein